MGHFNLFAAHPGLGQHQCLVNQFHGVDVPDVHSSGPREGQHAFDDPRDAVHILNHNFAELFGEIRVVDSGRHQLGEGADGRQRIANFVGDAGGQRAKCDQFVVVNGLFLNPPVMDDERQISGQGGQQFQIAAEKHRVVGLAAKTQYAGQLIIP